MSYFAYKDNDRKIIIYAHKYKETGGQEFFYCPNKNCNAHMILKSRNGKVKPHFSAIATHPHIPNCFASFLYNSQITYTSNNFDLDRFFDDLISNANNKTAHPETTHLKKLSKTDDHDSNQSNTSTINTLHTLFDFCISHSLNTKVNDLTVNDIICDVRNNAKYSKFVSGKKLILCKFSGYAHSNDKFPNTFFFKYPINPDASYKYTIISSITNQDVFKQIISLYDKYKYNPIVLLIDCKSNKNKIFTEIKSKKQIYVLKK
jgi:hypothetical protein